MEDRDKATTKWQFSRRQLIAGAGAFGLATVLTSLPSNAAVAGVTPAGGMRHLDDDGAVPTAVTYDQATFTFAPVALTSTTTPVRWERRSSLRSHWRAVPSSATSSLTVTPTWRDIGARYRAVGSGGQTLALRTLSSPSLVGVDPVAYGAVGDGLADDTAALNSAAAAAAVLGTGVDLSGRTYRVTNRIALPPGVTAFFGGAITQSGTTPSPVYFEGRAEGRSTNLSGCVIRDVDIALGAPDTALGIGGASASHVAVIGCSITNTSSDGTAIYLRNDMAGLADGTDIVIRSNTITVQDSVGRAIEIGTPFDIKGLSDMIEFWKTYYVGPDKFYTLTEVEVSDNVISGGYYGISMIALDDFTIDGNSSTLNMRNISAQSSCLRGQIRDNDLSESVSSSIHLAYGSSDFVIEDNRITTARAIGEGLLQAYVGCKNNAFLRNTISATHPSGPRWHIYTGVHADYNRFEGNVLSGTCSQAYIAVEAAWDSTNTHSTHRGTGLTVTDAFAISNSTWVKIIDNELDPLSSVEYMCFADIVDATGTYLVNFPTVSGNHLTGSSTPLVPHHYAG